MGWGRGERHLRYNVSSHDDIERVQPALISEPRRRSLEASIEHTRGGEAHLCAHVCMYTYM